MAHNRYNCRSVYVGCFIEPIPRSSRLHMSDLRVTYFINERKLYCDKRIYICKKQTLHIFFIY
jgi:hypothetical protein